MPAARKPKPKTELKVVGPDLDKLGEQLTEFAEQTRPMLTAADSVRQQHEAKRQEYANRLDEVQAERELVTRHFEAMMRSYDDQERDLSLAIELFDNGLNSLAQQVNKAAAE